MRSLQVVVEKVAEVSKVPAGIVVQAVPGLVNKAESLSLDDMSPRLDGALRALRGEQVSTSAAITTAQKTSLQIAHEMVDSYAFDKKTEVSTFTVPAGVTDVEAMKALNEYYSKNQPGFNRYALYANDLAWFEKLPKEYPTYCQERDYSQARQITITGVVKDTKGESRTTQEAGLKNESLGFADPRDQALAAAIHACKHNGEDLFKDLWVRGSVPGFSLCTFQTYGVSVFRFFGDDVSYRVAASGSPCPEVK
jgi:hypothetical protein